MLLLLGYLILRILKKDHKRACNQMLENIVEYIIAVCYYYLVICLI